MTGAPCPGTGPGSAMLKTMDVVVNGASEQFDPATTVAEVVDRVCPSPEGVAVARNGDVVPRSAWTHTALGTGDRLEILTAAAGG
jgi:sulfur carrier protein